MFGNLMNCGCCGDPPPGPPITIPGLDPCLGPVPFLASKAIFGGDLVATITYNGADVSTGTTSTPCLGDGVYVITVTSSNPHAVVTPASVTVTVTDDCGSLAYSSPSFFQYHFDYFDPPNNNYARVGDPTSTICGCPCLFPVNLHVACLNPDFIDAFYDLITGGTCEGRNATTTRYFYASGRYTSADLSFRALPAPLPTYPLTSFGGPVILPAWGFFSDPFDIESRPSESCGNIDDPCLPCGFRVGDCGIVETREVVVTGWYYLACNYESSPTRVPGVALFLIERRQGTRLVCDYTGAHYEPTESWSFTQSYVWNQFGEPYTGNPGQDCSPLYLSGGREVPGAAGNPDMVISE